MLLICSEEVERSSLFNTLLQLCHCNCWPKTGILHYTVYYDLSIPKWDSCSSKTVQERISLVLERLLLTSIWFSRTKSKVVLPTRTQFAIKKSNKSNTSTHTSHVLGCIRIGLIIEYKEVGGGHLSTVPLLCKLFKLPCNLKVKIKH